jgi:hypothetical protein
VSPVQEVKTEDLQRYQISTYSLSNEIAVDKSSIMSPGDKKTSGNSDSLSVNLENVKILLAEDNFTHKVLMNHILVTQLGVKESNVTFANDGQEAYQILK